MVMYRHQGKKMERWLPIFGYEGYYEVSNIGRVRSLDRIINNNGVMQKIRSAVLCGAKLKNGYRYVVLCRNGRGALKPIHRLVASAFLKNSDNFPCVNHKDGNKTNNCVENLEWCSFAQNSQHAWDNKLEKPYQCKKVLDNTTGIIYESIEEAARQTNKKPHIISRACNHSKKSRWSFVL